MKIKIFSIVILIMFLFGYSITFVSSSSNLKSVNDSDWYYLPGYPNYAPSGLPDFSQLQQKDWWGHKYPDCCGAVSLANVLWWFDSKNEDINGFPGDGNNTYPLVQDYCPLGIPNPGPNSDDHNFNNVNDNQTSFPIIGGTGELIERIAFYTNRQKNTLLPKFLGPFNGPYNALMLYLGANKWFRKSGLKNQYSIKVKIKPKFSFIDECVRNNKGVILGLLGYDPEVEPFGTIWGHFVAVAGVNSSGKIAFSDPVRDRLNPSLDPAEHNNASIVSHDIYNISLDSPWPLISDCFLPNYSKESVYIPLAIVISQIE